MQAVHFGAGNIGRGFIGSLLYQSGYELCFIDVNREVVDLLNEKKEYRVVMADESREEHMVRNVRAINSAEEADRVIQAVAEADLITAAVGPAILPHISRLVAEGLRKRTSPVNIIACENMIGGSTLLKEKVLEKIPEEERDAILSRTGFPDAAVDRIVPNQSNEDKLTVVVEPFYEWVVEELKLIGDKPAVEGITWVPDLKPYIERKLFTVNTGHAAAAYFGWQTGAQTIDGALGMKHVAKVLQAVLNETGRLLVTKYRFDQSEHDHYIQKIIGRFANPHIRDHITRVGRAPIRKLGGNDRLLSPAKQYEQLLGETPVYLAKSIAAALLYDYAQDPEAVEVQGEIEHRGIESALKKFTQLDESDPLFAEVMKQYELMREKGI
ncbi:mannitol-1-phosphate 5-dehydrogenase [Domibacillus indicus]|uniref:mannitol-1-phosphate 5-dehydrogenase n=1 Tax=Domibacillus indicus TaxID=1437523 RepID=UPI002040EC4F|nr:mannitol-1-phosphate 5-dehydrogenase [Domibacillus indicus]MCM3788677.1 mannitol-1-phosphate 5-dehydrogenase [Domibacillus indicus]